MVLTSSIELQGPGLLLKDLKGLAEQKTGAFRFRAVLKSLDAPAQGHLFALHYC